MKRASLVLLTALVAGSAFAQMGGNRNNQVDAIRFATVGRGFQSQITGTEYRLFSDENPWSNYYGRMVGPQARRNSQAPKWANFQEEFLLVIHLGQRNRAGFTAMVEGIEMTAPGQVTVRIALRTPPSDGPSAQVLTQPWLAVRIKKVAADFRFVTRELPAQQVPGSGGSRHEKGCGCCQPNITYILDPIDGLIIVEGGVLIPPPGGRRGG